MEEAQARSATELDPSLRYCGADCTTGDTYVRFGSGDSAGLVNADTGYRCCWLPSSYREGRDCPIKACCVGRGFDLCGECDRFDRCGLLRPFYAQPGYHALRDRMIRVVRERRLQQEPIRRRAERS